MWLKIDFLSVYFAGNLHFGQRSVDCDLAEDWRDSQVDLNVIN